MTIASAQPQSTLQTWPETETRILLDGVSWETFEQLLVETGDNRNKRFAYCDGVLEIMAPLEGHEESTRLFDDFVVVFIDALGLEVRKLGSLTMKNPAQKKGLEPDCCFYIQNESVVRGVETLDFNIHPPPDLAIEVDNSSSSLNKFPIYLALKIPELWRLRRGTLTIYQLNTDESAYVEVEQSLAFPHMPVQALPQFMETAKVIGQRAAVRELAKQVEELLTDADE
ncbi:Uma2 family endonuclease [Leptolyngbya iicbica]|uniref:Uma2 family endonuclease n=2 Tax=Cyanophyceae TaxID=3028117 RepID=A0A4Q7E239_9CYAN|nr:Uma2 family endonuclease [Leptolyngbya sp. LK]RZM75046.1 Uma2 family endonuclease [Leptolyngbya sp. LK]